MSPTITALLGAGLFAGTSALPPPPSSSSSSSSRQQRSAAAAREAELRAEKSRASGLRRSLADLNDFSVDATRRLDDGYYSVLEKVGQLSNIVLALKGLAGMAARTDEEFRVESRALAADVTAQIDAFGAFGEQADRIEWLTRRIHDGRDKVRVLGGRVEAVRERVERWERADQEWQERTRRRLKAIWVVLLGVGLGVVVLLVVVQFLSPGGLQEVSDGVRGGGKGEIAGGKGVLGTVLNRTVSHPIDETLRVFNEL